jgi:hypothetical protein
MRNCEENRQMWIYDRRSVYDNGRYMNEFEGYCIP